MAYPICKLKNLTGEVRQLYLHEFAIDELYPIPDDKRESWMNNSDTLIAISNEEFQVYNDLDEPIEGISDQINYLKNVQDPLPKMGEKDKIRVYSTPRPVGTKICFSSVGDDPDDVSAMWNGQELYHVHEIGNPLTESLYIDLNSMENRTFLAEGYGTWQNAQGDTISFIIVPRVTPTTPGSETNYDIYGGYLLVPASPGSGTVDVNPSEMKLIPVLPSMDTGEIKSSGYWNADWNSTTKEFENITPAYDGKGVYNAMTAEIQASIFCNKLIMFGTSSWALMRTSEAEQFPHNMRIKVVLNTREPDHEWSWGGIITLFREKTS